MREYAFKLIICLYSSKILSFYKDICGSEKNRFYGDSKLPIAH